MTIVLSEETESNAESIISALPSSVLKLTPRIHPFINDFLKEQNKVFELEQALGSPLNLLFPELVRENLQAFYNSMDKYSLQSKVYYAHKSNQSHSLVRQLAIEDKSFIDVSSTNELRHALSSGFSAQRIQATGPKNTEFLALSLMHNIVLNVDSLGEIAEILSLRQRLNVSSTTRILLRVSGFKSAHSQYRNRASRFGIPLTEIEQAFGLLKSAGEDLSLAGFAFHLDTVSLPEKIIAIENCLTLFEEAFEHGFTPTVLDIGGGFKSNYLASEEEWNKYTTALKESVIGSHSSITWQDNSFGLAVDKGILRGSFNSYNYYDPITGPQYLEEILSHQIISRGDTSIGSLIRDNGIELWIEPGRSLLDQTGITVARVNSIRQSTHNDTLVCLNMKRSDICFLDREVFVDPIVLYREPVQKSDPCTPVYFAGNLCIESDLVYAHQTFLPALPKAGDLIVFINTAGYFMDFSATQTIMQPPAKKVAIFKSDEQFAWALDEQYNPWCAKA